MVSKKLPDQKTSKDKQVNQSERSSIFHPRFMGAFADEVAKLVIQRLPKFTPRKKKKTVLKSQAIGGYFLDTSAIIDGRVFDVIKLNLISGPVIILDSVLLELKHIADSKDPIKKERGRRALENLTKIKKVKNIKFIVLPFPKNGNDKKEVDEQLIAITKVYKGKLITCDYNLEKKSAVETVAAINMHAVAQRLKVAAVPGEDLKVKILHVGKDKTQGVGYLDDGTMIVVENGSSNTGQILDVRITRVIQTSTGKILFARKLINRS
jgi:uncharacterized protein YacL